MPDAAAQSVQYPPVPVDIQAAINYLAERCFAGSMAINARVIGDPEMVDYLSRFGTVRFDDAHLIALGVDERDVQAAVIEGRPQRITVVVAGRLASILRPFRHSAVGLAHDLPERTWRAMGYRRARSQGILGLAPLVWAQSERLMHQLGRPDLADRSRIAMAQTLRTGGWSACLSTVIVREYWRAA